MVIRIFVEKKEKYANEAKAIKEDINNLLLIGGLKKLRIVNRYDVENIDEETFEKAKVTVFSEPVTDNVYSELKMDSDKVLAVEYLPGQFDQRANSAEESIQFISQGEKAIVKSAKVYMLYGNLTDTDMTKIMKFLINPVEAREATMEELDTLKSVYEIPSEIATVENFIKMPQEELTEYISENGLAMDLNDLLLCQEYFLSEKRNPTLTEIKVIDTYWSDHCRHTTFNTTIDYIRYEDEVIEKTFQDYLYTRRGLGVTKPISLMNIVTTAVKSLKAEGKLDKLVESEEINACTVNFTAMIDGKEEDWTLLFKNETHNHPTEIEPFGGAATCVGGAIRDPLSGRSYVYAAMRVTGAGNPLTSVEDTLEGKLPQRTIVKTAANGYSSYGNQIGLTTGLVDEVYHEGYVAKRMEIGAVIGAAPTENIVRIRPSDGDKVILLGGKTGRDGCGGATGSSKSHKLDSQASCGAEVQKGNPPEERKIQRLFRNPEATKLIKRCNDFGAGGVSVAIGELADGLEIELNKVPKKYEGLDGTELAISESQERMAVVIAKENVEHFMNLAIAENLESTVVATITEKPYLKMYWNEKAIVNISREFLDTNGAEKHINVVIPDVQSYDKEIPKDFTKGMKDLVGDLNVCSKRGLSERFDSTIGAGSVLMPFGGKNQRTPVQAMIHKIPDAKGASTTCSLMAYGFNPYILEKSPYHGAYLAVVESVSKLIAAGSSYDDTYLTFQEYFEKLGNDSLAWGKPTAAVLGAYRAQKELGLAAIGGKDSMSGTFEDIHVPPTLVSFAVSLDEVANIISPEFKIEGHDVVLVKPEIGEDGLPKAESLIKTYKYVNELIRSKKVVACYTPTYGGVAEAIYKMAIGNDVGFAFSEDININELFEYSYGSFIIELNDNVEVNYKLLGKTSCKKTITFKEDKLQLRTLSKIYEEKLEPVYTFCIKNEEKVEKISYTATDVKKKSNLIVSGRPKVLIPVFPGTNCEYDTAKAFEKAGAEAEVFVINNLNGDRLKASLEKFAEQTKQSQMIFIPGGFSGGDEPDGSGKFITAFFRNDEVKMEVENLLNNRDGLMAGICNGFQALVKLGLVPYGKIIDIDENCPTLTFNEIGRHQSKLVRTRISSNKSPWLRNTEVGDIYTVPVSHGEGRFIADGKTLDNMIKYGQVITQYVDFEGNPTMDIQFNPNGSVMAVEGITSPDGRVLGKMGHSERIGNGLYKNVPGEYDMKIFEAAVKYFK
ncbi:MAG: phosphoribosylformylglycinamidine synthase [Peptostreptococcaceae bacterium]|nr:phosphoribosylformylglycinamidine synthase [Peptostreptococcaceae bacterium]